MPHGRPAKNSCQRVCMPGVRTWFFIARCGNGDSSTRTKTWRKPRCPNCKRCKNDGADSWACLNLFEAEIAFRLGEIHIYLKNHQIQTSEFQSFCDRWIVFSPWRNDFLKKTVFHDLTFRSAGLFKYISGMDCVKDLPVDVLRKIDSEKIGDPKYLKVKYSEALKRIQHNIKYQDLVLK